MNHQLHFIRHLAVHDSSVIYHQYTDVWLVGDVLGFERFETQLRSQADSITALALHDQSVITHGMAALFLPPPLGIAEARIRIIERVRSLDGNRVMQLVVRATSSGYLALADIVRKALVQGRDVPDWHDHLDFGFPCYREGFGGVALRVCGPLTEFNRDNAEPYQSIIFDRQPRSSPNGFVTPWDDEEMDYVEPEELESLLDLS